LSWSAVLSIHFHLPTYVYVLWGKIHKLYHSCLKGKRATTVTFLWPKQIVLLYDVLNLKQDAELLCDKFSDTKAWDKRILLQERISKQNINHLGSEQNTLFQNLLFYQAIGSAKEHVRFHHLTVPESVLFKVPSWLQEDKSNQNVPQSAHWYWTASSAAATGDTRIKM
jgi:hypothetical protein